MACFPPLGRQTAHDCARFLPAAARRALRGQAAGAELPVGRGELAPVPAAGEMLLFRGLCNSPDKPNDVGGAFAPGAVLFAHYNTAPWSSIVVVDNGALNDRALALRGHDVVAALNAWNGPPLACVAFFCHGSTDWLQLGFNNPTADQLAQAIAAKARDDVSVALFACLTGASPEEWRYQKWRKDCEAARQAGRDEPVRPPNSEPPPLAGRASFALTLRDALMQHGAHHPRVDAHVSVGHATRNPDLRRFEAPAGSGGFRLTAGENDEVIRRRRRALAAAFRRPGATGSLLLYRFPFLSHQDIARELDRIAAAPPAEPEHRAR